MHDVIGILYIGNYVDCFYNENPEWAVIHACKSPCHQRVLRYRGSLLSNHPHYLTYEKGSHLYLNIIDPPQPLFKLPLFTESLSFIDKYISDRKILIHCNLGHSRAPSIALLWLAKRKKHISNESYLTALSDFKKIYPCYQPGSGISYYLQQNWKDID